MSNKLKELLIDLAVGTACTIAIILIFAIMICIGAFILKLTGNIIIAAAVSYILFFIAVSVFLLKNKSREKNND